MTFHTYAPAIEYKPTLIVAHRNNTLFKLFRAIIFCRPELHLFEPLSQYVETVANQESLDGCNRICSDFGCEDIITSSNHNIRQFTNETCPLQVYAARLEIGVQELENEPLASPDARITALAQIAIRSMRFLRHCLKRTSCWLVRAGCNCYAHMVTSTVSQLYVLTKCWLQNIDCLSKLAD